MAAFREIDVQQFDGKRVTRSSTKSVSTSSSNLKNNKIGNESSKCISKTARGRRACPFKSSETEGKEEVVKIRPVCVRCPKLHLESKCMLLKDIPCSTIASTFEAKGLQCYEKTMPSLSRRETSTYNDGQNLGSENGYSSKDDVVIVDADEKRQTLSRESAVCSNHREHSQVTMRAHQIDSPANTSTVCFNTQDKDSIAAGVGMNSLPKIISVMTRLVEAVESTIQLEVTTTTSTMKRIVEATKNTDAGCDDLVKERVFNVLTTFFSNLRTKKSEPSPDQIDVQECEPDSTAYNLENNPPMQPSDATAINCNNSASRTPNVTLTTNLTGTELIQSTQMNENTDLLVADETASLSGGTTSEVDLKLRYSEDERHSITSSDSLAINPRDPTKTSQLSSAAKVTVASEPTNEKVDLNLASSNDGSKNEGEPQAFQVNREARILAEASNISADQQTSSDDRSASTLDTYQRISNVEEETQILVNNIPDTDHLLSEDESEYSEVHDTVDEIISSLEASEKNDIQDISKPDQDTVTENSSLLAPKEINESNRKEQESSCSNNTQNSVMTHSVSEAKIDNNLSNSRDILSDSESDDAFSSPSKVDSILLKSIESNKRSKSKTMLKNTIYTSTEEEDSSDESLQRITNTPSNKFDKIINTDEKEHKKRNLNATSNHLNVISSGDIDSSSSSDDEIIDLTQNDDSEPKKNRFELELQILKEIMKEKQAGSSKSQVENGKSSTPTHDSDKTPYQNEKTKSSESKQAEPENNKTPPIMMIAPKVTPKKRSIQDSFTVSSLASENSSDEEVSKPNNEPTKKKKLNILDHLPAAAEIKVTKKDKVKAQKDQPPLPKTLSSKVKSVLSAGERDVPIVSKKSEKKKKLADQSSSPERIWKSLNVFDISSEESSVGSRKVYKPNSFNASTDFVVQPLNVKSQKATRVPEYLSSTALDFKRKSMFNDKIRRESSKDLLKRKIRKKF